MALEINKIHIRFEDDYYAQESPFAFGLTCERITSTFTQTEWMFDSLENIQFRRATPTDNEGLIIRETSIINAQIYWKSMAEMYVPLSLWTSTQDSENQIFDAIALEDLRGLMKKYVFTIIKII